MRVAMEGLAGGHMWQGESSEHGPERAIDVTVPADSVARVTVFVAAPYGNGHSEASVTSFAALAETTEPLKAGEICPDCQNATLMNEEGCRKCHSCGYAEC